MKNDMRRIWIPGISLLILALYSAALFLLGNLSHVCLWVGFGFVVVTFLVNSGLLWYSVRSPFNGAEVFYQLPLFQICAAWEAVVLVLSTIVALLPDGAVRWAVLLELAAAVLFVILVILSLVNSQKLREMRTENKEKAVNIVREELASRRRNHEED